MLSNPEWGLDEVGITLKKAGDYMEEHGHCKGRLWNSEGRVCLLGALLKVTGNYHRLYYQCIDTMGKAGGFKGSGAILELETKLVEWNNTTERRGEEVVDLFRKATELRRETA